MLALTNGSAAPAQSKKPGQKINLDDFDDEINGINLSKLFSAYGPSSMLEKD